MGGLPTRLRSSVPQLEEQEEIICLMPANRRWADGGAILLLGGKSVRP
jgi:hypothetical protein